MQQARIYWGNETLVIASSKSLQLWLPLMTCRRQLTLLSIQSYPSYPYWTLKSLENRMNLLCLISFVLLLGRFHHGPSFIAWKWSSFSQSTMHFVSLQLEGLIAVFVWYNQQFFLLSTREIATGFIFIYLLHSVIPPIWRTRKELLLKLLLLACKTHRNWWETSWRSQ